MHRNGSNYEASDEGRKKMLPQLIGILLLLLLFIILPSFLILILVILILYPAILDKIYEVRGFRKMVDDSPVGPAKKKHMATKSHNCSCTEKSRACPHCKIKNAPKENVTIYYSIQVVEDSSVLLPGKRT